LQQETGYTAIAGPTLLRNGADYGNGLLTRFSVLSVKRIDLCVARCEPRGALDVELDCGGTPMRVLATHLGLRPAERREQIQRLLVALENDRPLPTMLMGDINEWFLWGRPLRWMHKHFQQTPSPSTFPSRCPVFALDRVWVKPRALLRAISVHSSPLSKIASDHLPLTAELDLQCGGRMGDLAQGTMSRMRRATMRSIVMRGVQEEVRNVARAVRDAVVELRAGRLPAPDAKLMARRAK
jgi:endonuclease/exonuclease/phosphatase family metal-dependent hydrolase